MQRKRPEGLLELGRVAGTYGVRGWIKVDRPEQALAGCSRWWIAGTEYAVEEVKAHSGALLARLAGIDSREAAQKLRGATVAVDRDKLPDPGRGHYYHADLMGLAVVNGRGEALGTVKKLFTNGAQDVMELEPKARLLPWVPAVVKEVDLQKKQITVDWEVDW